MKTRQRRGFTQRELAEAANNLVVKALRPLSLGEIPEERLRKLRAYAQAVIKPCFEHVEEGLLRPEELVAIGAVFTMYTQTALVMHTDKLPMAPLAGDMYDEDKA